MLKKCSAALRQSCRIEGIRAMKTIIINRFALLPALLLILLSIKAAVAAEEGLVCPKPTEASARELKLNIEDLKQHGDLVGAIPHAKCLGVVAGSLFGLNHPTTLNVKKDLQDILRKTGHEAEANAITQELFIEDKQEDHQVSDSAIQSLILESRSLLTRGDRDGAGKACQQARYLSQVQKLENTVIFSAVLNECGRVYEAMGNIPMAKQRYGDAIDLARKVDGSKSPHLAVALNNLGLLNLHIGEIGQALEQLQEVIKIDGNGNPSSIPTITNLGLAYEALRNFGEAQKHFFAARQLALENYGQWHPYLSNIYMGLGAMAWRTGKIDEAIEWHRQLNLNAEYNLASNLLIGSDLQKQALVRELNGTKDALITLHLDEVPNSTNAAKIALTTLLQHKGRVQDALGTSMAVLHQHASKDEKELLDSLREVTSEWSALVNRGPGSLTPENYRQRISALEEDAITLEKKLSASSANLIKQKPPVTLEAVQAALPETAALIELALYRPFNTKALKQNEKFGEPQYAAYVLHPTGEPCAVKLGAAKNIEPIVEAWRHGLDSRSDAVSRGVFLPGVKEETKQANISKELYLKFMSPIREKCLGNSKMLFFSPDGSFNLMPIAALVDENGHYLIEDYHITYLTSGRDLLKLKNEMPSQGKAIVIADPDYGLKSGKGILLVQTENDEIKGRSRDFTGQVGTFNRLEKAAEEAKAITKLLNIPTEQYLTEKRATEEAVKALHGPQILHIATHGFFLPDKKDESSKLNELTGNSTKETQKQTENPLLRSGLALTGANQLQSGKDDGILTALEASSLDLVGTKLVVLSACETGLGDVRTGEGVYGLRRAIVNAGAESQVLSLWQVDDVGTKELMLNYYRKLLDGEGRSEALRQAQLALIKSDKYNHPYFWASFIASGNTRPIKSDQ